MAVVPMLAGRTVRCMVLPLRDFRATTRTNDAGNMTSVPSTRSDAGIENIAHCIAGR